MGLGSDFYDPYDKWVRVGWALRNTPSSREDKDILFAIWLKFSSKSEKFSFGDIDSHYEKWKMMGQYNSLYKNERITYKSIIYWCRTTNLDHFNSIQTSSIETLIDKIIFESHNQTDFAYAKLLYEEYSHQFVCASVSRKIWYEFDGNKWLENDCGTTLRSKISVEICKKFLHRLHEAHQRNNPMNASLNINENDLNQSNLEQEEESKKNTMIANTCVTICKALKTSSQKENIMREARELFYNKEFIDSLDADPYLMCFDNGVVDFREKVFRPGRPEDYLSISTETAYAPLNQNKHSKEIQEIEEKMNLR